MAIPTKPSGLGFKLINIVTVGILLLCMTPPNALLAWFGSDPLIFDVKSMRDIMFDIYIRSRAIALRTSL
jgi:hypothetical protein